MTMKHIVSLNRTKEEYVGKQIQKHAINTYIYINYCLMLSMLLCSDNDLTSIDIRYTRGTHCNTVIMKMGGKVSINKTKQ